MISVDQALHTLLDLTETVGMQTCALRDAGGRVLRVTQTATRAQPPFDASAMDGYAVSDAQTPTVGARWVQVGTAAAGHGFHETLRPGQAVRIFTGAPVPKNTTRILLQENISTQGKHITLTAPAEATTYIRPAGCDFDMGFELPAPQVLGRAQLALLPATNVPEVKVSKRPVVAIMATGDELVFPGEKPGPDQIVASNVFGLIAMFEAAGATVRLLPIADDTMTSLKAGFELAGDADLIVTIGGASVGDHDLIAATLDALGFHKMFYKIRMRPGKPLMAAKRGAQMVIGLPGNPVSALVCAQVFCVPVIRQMLGMHHKATNVQTGILAHDIPANGGREHYMRGIEDSGLITVFEHQDSALLSVLHRANVLIRRPVNDPARAKGANVDFLYFGAIAFGQK